MAALNVIIPPGMKPGQEIQAQSPDGTLVQAKIPNGMKPGQTFTVQYTPIAPATASTSWTANPGAWCGKMIRMYSGGEVIVLCGLAAIGFSLPWFLKDAGGILHVVSTYIIPVAVAGCAVAYDWNLKGPTVAIKNTLAAATLAWVLVVPLGIITRSLLHYLSTLLVIAAAVMLIFTLFIQYGICGGWLLALLVLTVFVTFGGPMVWLISGPCGTAIVFVVAFFCARVVLGVVFLRDLDPNTWPGVREVSKDSDEFRSQKDHFMASCEPWKHKYDFDLSVDKLYRIDRPPATPAAPAQSSSQTDSQALFHGTPWEAAMGIVCDGFRLPNNPGMFGKGIYFADCPLKSWRYCFASKEMANALPRITGKGGYILMCWVDLGKKRQEKEAKPELKGYNRRSWMNWLTGHRGAYDSVQGLTEEEGGALRVPEYIVYDTAQIRLAYLFEVQKTDRSAASNSNNI